MSSCFYLDFLTLNGNSDRHYFGGGSKITTVGDCSHETKRRLLLGRKAMTHLDSVKKQRHYFANKAPSSQDYVFFVLFLFFPVVTYECSSWTIKQAEC